MRLRVFAILAMASLPATAADADLERGRDLFRTHCIACHAIECNRIGPDLGV